MNSNEEYNNFLQMIKDGERLSNIPQEYRTYEMCLEAVRRNGITLCCVPRDLRSYEICLYAVKQYGYVLSYVPIKYRDYGMCLTAVKSSGFAIDYVPRVYLNKKLYIEAVKQNGRVLKYIPIEERDYEICKEALNQISKNMSFRIFISNKEYENNVVIESIIQNKWILNYIPDEYKDKLIQEFKLDKEERLLCI